MDAARRRDEDDDSDEAANPRSLAALEESRKEILARLRVATNALRDAGAVSNGYDSAFFLVPPPPDYAPGAIHERFFRRRTTPIEDSLWQKLSAQRFAFDPPDRVRLEWRVNDLGREKCRVLWELFDVDGDGLWSYTDFVEYRTAIEERLGERPEMCAISGNEEVWRMYTNDVLVTDATSHHLTFDGFLRYREVIEDAYPLIYDLQAMGVSLEWRVVEKVRRVLQLVGEYFGRDDVLPLKYVQFLLAECGAVATYRDLWQTVQLQRLFHRCHRFVLAQKRALRLFGYKQKTAIQLTSPALEEDTRVCRAGLLALVFSAWTPVERTRWRSFFLLARLQSYALLRNVKRRIASFFDWTRKAARTGLLRASCLQSTPERELGDHVFKVDVGSSFTTRSTINFTYYSDADSAATLHEIKYLERGAECFLFVDLLCRPGTREVDAQALSQKLSWFIELFFKDHLELLPFFFKWFTTVPSKAQLRATGGGSSASATGAPPVVRFVLLFTGEMDLYEVMQSLQLPSSMQFDHLLQRLTMRWMFSHTMEELLTNKRLVVGSQWGCRGQLDARFNRQAWGQILRQGARQMNDELVMEQEEREFMEAQQRQQQQQQDKHKEKGKVSSREVPQYVDSDRDTLRAWINWLERVALLIDSVKELSLSWSFRSLQSVLDDNAWLKTVVSPSTFERLHRLVSSAGALATEWKSIGDSFRAEFADCRFVEATVAASAALPIGSSLGTRGTPVRSGLSSADDRQNSSGSRRGSSSQSSIVATFPFYSAVSTPVTTARGNGSPLAAAVMEEADKSDHVSLKNDDPLEYDLLEFYEMCTKTLQSVHAMRAEAGTSGVAVALEGWNVFSVLPRVVPTTLVGRRSVVVRTKSTMSNASDGSLSATLSAGVGPTTAGSSRLRL